MKKKGLLKNILLAGAFLFALGGGICKNTVPAQAATVNMVTSLSGTADYINTHTYTFEYNIGDESVTTQSTFPKANTARLIGVKGGSKANISLPNTVQVKYNNKTYTLYVTEIGTGSPITDSTDNSAWLTYNLTVAGADLLKINDNAFQGLQRPIKFTGSSCTSLVYVGKNAFKGCNMSDSAITFSKIETIGESAFQGITSSAALTGTFNLALPESFTMGDNAFDNTAITKWAVTSSNKNPTVTSTSGVADGSVANKYAYTFSYNIGNTSNTKENADNTAKIERIRFGKAVAITLPNTVSVVYNGSTYVLKVVELGNGTDNIFKEDELSRFIKEKAGISYDAYKITISGANLIKINDYAFKGIPNSIVFTASNCKALEYIGKEAFKGCDLTGSDLNIVIGTIKEIGESAFQDTTATAKIATTITVPYPDSLTIGANAFLNSAIDLPLDESYDTVITSDDFEYTIRYNIGNTTTTKENEKNTAVITGIKFNKNSNLTIPSTLKVTHSNGKTYVVKVTELGDGEQKVVTNEGTAKITINNANIKRINDHAFENISNPVLFSASDCKNIEYIGINAFKGCTITGSNLKLPASLKTIKVGAFKDTVSTATLTGTIPLPLANEPESLIEAGAFENSATIDWSYTTPAEVSAIVNTLEGSAAGAAKDGFGFYFNYKIGDTSNLNENENNTATITGVRFGKAANLDIPYTVKVTYDGQTYKLRVTEIGDGNKNILIDDSLNDYVGNKYVGYAITTESPRLIKINSHAFEGIANPIILNMGNMEDLIYIGECAFKDCVLKDPNTHQTLWMYKIDTITIDNEAFKNTTGTVNGLIIHKPMVKMELGKNVFENSTIRNIAGLYTKENYELFNDYEFMKKLDPDMVMYTSHTSAKLGNKAINGRKQGLTVGEYTDTYLNNNKKSPYDILNYPWKKIQEADGTPHTYYNIPITNWRRSEKSKNLGLDYNSWTWDKLSAFDLDRDDQIKIWNKSYNKARYESARPAIWGKLPIRDGIIYRCADLDSSTNEAGTYAQVLRFRGEFKIDPDENVQDEYFDVNQNLPDDPHLWCDDGYVIFIYPKEAALNEDKNSELYCMNFYAQGALFKDNSNFRGKPVIATHAYSANGYPFGEYMDNEQGEGTNGRWGAPTHPLDMSGNAIKYSDQLVKKYGWSGEYYFDMFAYDSSYGGDIFAFALTRRNKTDEPMFSQFNYHIVDPQEEDMLQFERTGDNVISEHVPGVHTTLEDPEYNGYKFDGWYMDPECTEPAPESFTLDYETWQAEYHLYGKFVIKQTPCDATLNIYPNNGEWTGGSDDERLSDDGTYYIETRYYYDDEPVPTMYIDDTKITREGFIFDGWDYDGTSDCWADNTFTFNDGAIGNLHARWKRTEDTVTAGRGGKGVSVTVNDGRDTVFGLQGADGTDVDELIDPKLLARIPESMRKGSAGGGRNVKLTDAITYMKDGKMASVSWIKDYDKPEITGNPDVTMTPVPAIRFDLNGVTGTIPGAVEECYYVFDTDDVTATVTPDVESSELNAKKIDGFLGWGTSYNGQVVFAKDTPITASDIKTILDWDGEPVSRTLTLYAIWDQRKITNIHVTEP